MPLIIGRCALGPKQGAILGQRHVTQAVKALQHAGRLVLRARRGADRLVQLPDRLALVPTPKSIDELVEDPHALGFVQRLRLQDGVEPTAVEGIGGRLRAGSDLNGHKDAYPFLDANVSLRVQCRPLVPVVSRPGDILHFS